MVNRLNSLEPLHKAKEEASGLYSNLIQVPEPSLAIKEKKIMGKLNLYTGIGLFFILNSL